MAQTADKAGRLREKTIARLLKQHRISRLNAETACSILRQRTIKVAAGVTEAAVLDLRSLFARLRVVNSERDQAERKLDELCTELSERASEGQSGELCDVAILKYLPGIGKVTLAALLAEASGHLSSRDYNALRTL